MPNPSVQDEEDIETEDRPVETAEPKNQISRPNVSHLAPPVIDLEDIDMNELEPEFPKQRTSTLDIENLCGPIVTRTSNDTHGKAVIKKTRTCKECK